MRLYVLLLLIAITIYALSGHLSESLSALTGLPDVGEEIKLLSILLAIYSARGMALSYAERLKVSHRSYAVALINVLSLILAGGVLLAFFGLSQESIATVLGITAAGLAVALQQPILNAAGFLSIKLANLYKRGDFIQIDGILGRVEAVSIMHTKVREYNERGTEQGVFIYVPNAKALTMDVKNLTRPIKYVVDEVAVSLTYDSDIGGALKALRSIVGKILPEENFWFRLDFAPSSVDVYVVFKTSFEEKVGLHSKIVEEVFSKLPKMAKADFAFPHRVVILKEDGKRLAGGKGSKGRASGRFK